MAYRTCVHVLLIFALTTCLSASNAETSSTLIFHTNTTPGTTDKSSINVTLAAGNSRLRYQHSVTILRQNSTDEKYGTQTMLDYGLGINRMPPTTGTDYSGTDSDYVPRLKVHEQRSTMQKTGENGPRRPNIVLVLADDLGVGETSVGEYFVHTGCKRNRNAERFIRTPNLERMAANGVAFVNAYTPGPICGPSRVSLLTGRHTGRTTVRGNSGIGVDFNIQQNLQYTTPSGKIIERESMAQVLKKNGYKTGIIGKWGLGEHENGHLSSPVDIGFDTFVGFLTHTDAHIHFPSFVHNDSIDLSTGTINQGIINLTQNKHPSEATCTEPWHSQLKNDDYNPYDARNEGCVFSHDIFTYEALKFIESESNEAAPFFLFLSYTVPHMGSWVAENDISHWSDRFRLVAPYIDPDCVDNIELRRSKNTKFKKLEECRYASMITNYLDRDVGRILDKLEILGISNDTLVVFASDNGPQISTKYNYNKGGMDYPHSSETFGSVLTYSGGKNSLHEGGIRTVLLAQWPGMIQSHEVNEELVMLSDLYQTFAEVSLIGLKSESGSSENFDFYWESENLISLLPFLIGRDGERLNAPRHEYLYWEFCPTQVSDWLDIKSSEEGTWKHCSYTIRDNDGFKVFYDNANAMKYLFDLKKDNDESSNKWMKSKFSATRQHFEDLVSTARISLDELGYNGEPFI